MPTGQIHIDVKTCITTSVPHNGIIIQSGIQPSSDTNVWPCTLNNAPSSQSAHRIQSIQVPSALQRTDREQPELEIRKNIPESPICSFSSDDTPPDEFLTPENVRLNVFKTDPIVTEPQSGSEWDHSTKKHKTATVDSRVQDESATAYRRPLGLVQQQPNFGSTYSNWESSANVKTQRDLTRPASASELYSQRDLETRATVTTGREVYQSDASICQGSGDPNRIPTSSYTYDRVQKEYSRTPPLGSGQAPHIMADPNATLSAKTGMVSTYKSTPDLRVPSSSLQYPLSQKATNASLRDVGRVVPEEMFHLYQTRDAFGNLLAQW